MTTYTDRTTPRPLQSDGLNMSTRNGLVHALITTYQSHMNNPLPPKPAWGEWGRFQDWGEPSDREIISMHRRKLTAFYVRYRREFTTKVPVIKSGSVIDPDYFLERVSQLIEALVWSRVYDLLEFWMEHYPGPRELVDRFAERIEAVLEHENVDHRLLHGRFIPVSDDVEREALASATDATNTRAHVRAHIEKAMAFIRTGDYRQSVHESISAVEAQCSIIIGKSEATLGDALKELGGKWQFHPALVRTYSTMYGWSSNESGIRHPLRPDVTTRVDHALAKLILVQCSAFINYTETTYETEQPVDTEK